MMSKFKMYLAKLAVLWAWIRAVGQDDKKAAGFGVRTVEDDEREASRLLVWTTAGVLLFGLIWLTSVMEAQIAKQNWRQLNKQS